MIVTFGSWLEDEFGLTPAGLSAVTFLLGAGELVATLSVARFTDIWGKRRSVAVGAAVMVPASVGLALLHHHLIIGVALLAIGVLGFEFSVVSAISLGTGLVPGSPARGLGLLIGVDTIGRAADVGAGDAARTPARHRLAGGDGGGPRQRSRSSRSRCRRLGAAQFSRGSRW